MTCGEIGHNRCGSVYHRMTQDMNVNRVRSMIKIKTKYLCRYTCLTSSYIKLFPHDFDKSDPINSLTLLRNLILFDPFYYFVSFIAESPGN